MLPEVVHTFAGGWHPVPLKALNGVEALHAAISFLAALSSRKELFAVMGTNDSIKFSVYSVVWSAATGSKRRVYPPFSSLAKKLSLCSLV